MPPEIGRRRSADRNLPGAGRATQEATNRTGQPRGKGITMADKNATPTARRTVRLGRRGQEEPPGARRRLQGDRTADPAHRQLRSQARRRRRRMPAGHPCRRGPAPEHRCARHQAGLAAGRPVANLPGSAEHEFAKGFRELRRPTSATPGSSRALRTACHRRCGRYRPTTPGTTKPG